MFFIRQLGFKHYVLISIFIWSSIFIFEFLTVYDQWRHEVLNSMDKLALNMETQNSRFFDMLSYGQQIFSQSRNAYTDTKYLKKNLVFNRRESIYELANAEKNNMGTLTYIGKSLNKEKISEMEKALSLTPLFQQAARVFPLSPWIYYTSSDFIYMYPYIKPGEFKFSNEILNAEFYKMSVPDKNPQRLIKRTNPYYDLAGKGMMVTVSAPVYDKEKFLGTISIDVILKEFESGLNLQEFKKGRLQIITEEGNLLASNENKYANVKSVIKFSPPVNKNKVQIYFSRITFNKRSKALGAFIIYDIPLKIFFSAMFFRNHFSLALLVVIIVLLWSWKKTSKMRLQQEADDVHKNKLISLAEMSGGIAHEINNPLTVVIGKINQLKRKVANNEASIEEIQNNLEIIAKSSERIAKIIRALKNFARNESLDAKESVPISTIINDALLLCENRIKNNDFQLIVDTIPEININCHAYQIVQILINLINNSFDAIAHQQERWVRISFKVEKENIEIRVIDSGTGIKRSEQKKIFEPFYSSKPVGFGTGLGLSISKRLANYHDGDLYLDSESKHTCFVLKLRR